MPRILTTEDTEATEGWGFGLWVLCALCGEAAGDQHRGFHSLKRRMPSFSSVMLKLIKRPILTWASLM